MRLEATGHRKALKHWKLPCARVSPSKTKLETNPRSQKFHFHTWKLQYDWVLNKRQISNRFLLHVYRACGVTSEEASLQDINDLYILWCFANDFVNTIYHQITMHHFPQKTAGVARVYLSTHFSHYLSIGLGWHKDKPIGNSNLLFSVCLTGE